MDLARRLRPDVVLMDVRMPRLDGIGATKRIVQLDPPPAVLVVTTFDLDTYVYEALRAGACGFLLKDAPERQLLSAVRSSPGGVALLSPTVTRRLVEAFAHPTARSSSRLEQLTHREAEVLQQVALGLSNSQVAEALTIEETTVKSHVSRLLTKLGLTSRTQAVVLAYETGLVKPGSSPTTSPRSPPLSA